MTETETLTKTVTVSTTIPVRVYELPRTLEGYYAAYADDSAEGYAVSADGHRWGGFRVGETIVKNRWGYLTARNPAWDALVISTAASETQQLSPAIPVSVYAVPLNRSPAVAGAGQSAVLESWGAPRTHSGVPSAFTVDTPRERYRGISGIAARLQPSTNQTTESQSTDETSDPSGPEPITVFGLVRGVNHTIASANLETRSVREATLALSVDRTTARSTALTVHLEATDDTGPISLQQANNPRTEPIGPVESDDPSPGVVVIESLQTGETWHVHPANGTRTLEVAPTGAFTAEYRPASWLVAAPAYQPATSGATALDWTIQGALDWIVLLVVSFAPFAALYYALGGLERILTGNPRQ